MKRNSYSDAVLLSQSSQDRAASTRTSLGSRSILLLIGLLAPLAFSSCAMESGDPVGCWLVDGCGPGPTHVITATDVYAITEQQALEIVHTAMCDEFSTMDLTRLRGVHSGYSTDFSLRADYEVAIVPAPGRQPDGTIAEGYLFMISTVPAFSETSTKADHLRDAVAAEASKVAAALPLAREAV
jgi:hypothetical protein